MGRLMMTYADRWAGRWWSHEDGWAHEWWAMRTDGPVDGCPTAETGGPVHGVQCRRMGQLMDPST